jgi:Kdo2-lipid A phosphotransferase
MNNQSQSWNIKGLLFCHGLLAFLLITFFCPTTRVYWEKLDYLFFQWVNGSLKGRPYLQLFWGFANHRFADWLEDLVILIFFSCYFFKQPKEKRKTALIQILFIVLYTAAIIFFVNRCLFRQHLSIYRDGPNDVLNGIRLSQEIPWIHLKDHSSKSFPGDHATTALLFAASYFYFVRKNLGLAAIGYGIFLCLPRLVAGAHWLSDVIVGSGAIVLFFLSWAFYSPLFSLFSRLFSMSRTKKESLSSPQSLGLEEK